MSREREREKKTLRLRLQMEQTNSRARRGEKRPFSSLFFQFLHNGLRFYDTPESPAGPIKPEVKKKRRKKRLFHWGGKKAKSF